MSDPYSVARFVDGKRVVNSWTTEDQTSRRRPIGPMRPQAPLVWSDIQAKSLVPAASVLKFKPVDLAGEPLAFVDSGLRLNTGLRIFVISLERCLERRRHMERFVRRLGLTVEFISAVDGQRLTEAQRARYDRAKARQVYGADMTDAEIACYLSHYAVYQTIVEQNIERALILEDDLDCADDLADVVADLAAQPDPPWQVVRLQSPKSSVIHPKTAKARGTKVSEVSRRGVYRLQNHVLGGCAYVMRKSAAETMLAYGERIFMPIDQTLDRFWENGIVPYVVRPFPVWQHERFDSAIGARGRDAEIETGTWRVLQRRARRLFDSLNKRLFLVASRKPRLARILAFLRIDTARLALNG